MYGDETETYDIYRMRNNNVMLLTTISDGAYDFLA
jgi:hypothetical protein